MRYFQVAIFCFVICSMVKLNKTQQIPDSFLTSEKEGQDDIQNEAQSDEKIRILENSDLKLENNDANLKDKLNENLQNVAVPLKDDEEPGRGEFSSRVRRDKKLTDYSQCGLDLGSLFADGRRNSENTGVWPWFAALYDIDENPEKAILCGGSIINQKFVLTTAVCATNFRTREAKEANEIMVVLGLANPGGVEHAQEFQVHAVYVHPNFNAKTYDYDIALLEMEKPIEYNYYMRPICLPEIPKNGDFYEPQSQGLAVGWGKYNMTSQGSSVSQSNVKEIELIIQHPDVCIRSLRRRKLEHYFTDRMFCAAEVKGYSCGGDSGGPAMHSSVNKDGYRVWTQVGMISYGVGCGLPDEFGYYTHVYKLMPWIGSVTDRALENSKE